MDSFMSVAAWTSHQPEGQRSGRGFGHFRSLSSITASRSPNRPARPPGKSPSTSELPIIPTPLSSTASPALMPSSSPLPLDFDHDGELSTLPDPRSRAMSPANDDAISTASNPPDPNDEITTLSTKLINAINHQTNLDNTLSSTRHELEREREHVKQLETQNARQQEMLSGDVWVKRKTYENETKALVSKAANEKKARLEAEKEKRKMELEVETLTASLFEEANKMVIQAKEDARDQQEALQKKNDQLKAQIADSEALLLSQQEQLAELKRVVEQISAEHDDQTNVTAPSSPGFSKFDAKDDDRIASSASPLVSPVPDPISPAYPTSFIHLIQPVLRIDLVSYQDFQALAKVSRNRANSTRVSSAPLPGHNVVGLGLGGAASSAHPSNSSSSSLTTNTTQASPSPQSPFTPGSITSNTSGPLGNTGPALKETKFYKRILTEDVEPTLRLDLAPGLSWLARRSAISAMTDGTLIVEPAATSPIHSSMMNPQHYSCALCGESRKDASYLRTHRFRIGESESAQRYPLCGYCLGRVRSTCDFLGFLRLLRDGHWRTDSADAEKSAWEESVRLREQMFWSRIGGGVIPASHTLEPDASPRIGQEETLKVLDGTGEATGITVQVDAPEQPKAVETTSAIEDDRPVTPVSGKRDSAQSLGAQAVSSTGPEHGGTKRLSITIPVSPEPKS